MGIQHRKCTRGDFAASVAPLWQALRRCMSPAALVPSTARFRSGEIQHRKNGYKSMHGYEAVSIRCAYAILLWCEGVATLYGKTLTDKCIWCRRGKLCADAIITPVPLELMYCSRRFLLMVCSWSASNCDIAMLATLSQTALPSTGRILCALHRDSRICWQLQNFAAAVSASYGRHSLGVINTAAGQRSVVWTSKEITSLLDVSVMPNAEALVPVNDSLTGCTAWATRSFSWWQVLNTPAP